MTLSEAFKLAHREVAAHRVRSAATVVVVGALFGLLLGVLFVVRGLEDVALRYASDATGGSVYLVSRYNGGAEHRVIFERIDKYGGKVVSLTDGQKEMVDGPLLENAVVAGFEDLEDAFRYFSKDDATELAYTARNYEIVEIFSNQMAVMDFFERWNWDLVYPVSAVLVIISAFVLAMTMAHIIMNNARIFALYKSVGASKWQVMLICFAYILEISALAALFAVGLALILAGVATAVGWDYLTAQLKGLYPEAPEFAPILLGVDWRAGVVLLAIFLTSPVAMLLCLDQFSDKKIAKRLKEE